MIEHQIKTWNDWGRSKPRRFLIAVNIMEPNLTTCFVSTLDAHFWCVFSSLLIKDVLVLSQRLVYTWSYPRTITLEKVAWINSPGAWYCSRRNYLEYHYVWLLKSLLLFFWNLVGERSFSSPTSDTGGGGSIVMLLARWKVLRAAFASLNQTPKTRKSRLGCKHIKPLSWVDEVHWGTPAQGRLPFWN